MEFEYYIPTRILFGEGAAEELCKRKLPGKKAFLVTSCGNSAKLSGALDKIMHALAENGEKPVLFDKIPANPTLDCVDEGADAAKTSGCDYVVALGGGSVMDAAKAIALLAPNGGSYWDYVSAGTGGGKLPEKSALPIVAITTTAGTGSEADATAVITNTRTGEKIGFVHPEMFPVLSVVDSSLTHKIPPVLTAYQGFDALFHATECFISAKANKMSDMLALTAIEYIGKYLARAVKCGEDAEARDGMSFANTLSGMVMTLSGCTAKHGMEHAMSALKPALAHGAGLIMLAPAYYRFIVSLHACDARFIRMAQAIGNPFASKAEDFCDALSSIMRECGVDGLKMSDYGITEHDLPLMAENAMTSMKRVFLNERVQLTKENVIEIYKNSYR